LEINIFYSRLETKENTAFDGGAWNESAKCINNYGIFIEKHLFPPYYFGFACDKSGFLFSIWAAPAGCFSTFPCATKSHR